MILDGIHLVHDSTQIVSYGSAFVPVPVVCAVRVDTQAVVAEDYLKQFC